MQIFPWDNDLAVKLPENIVHALGLKEGDEIELDALDKHTLGIAKIITREQALQIFKDLNRPLPPGFKFSREEANER